MKSTFNPNFYRPRMEYTREMAEARLKDLGYTEFYFTGCSHSNGASFYFELKDGTKVRVSDHPLTGRRAFDYIDISIVPIKTLDSPFAARRKYIAGALTKSEYRAMCKNNGWIYRP